MSLSEWKVFDRKESKFLPGKYDTVEEVKAAAKGMNAGSADGLAILAIQARKQLSGLSPVEGGMFLLFTFNHYYPLGNAAHVFLSKPLRTSKLHRAWGLLPRRTQRNVWP